MSAIIIQQALQNKSAKAVAGTTIEIDVNEFLLVLNQVKDGILFEASTSLFGKKYQYALSFGSFTVLTRSKKVLEIPPSLIKVTAKKVWFPEI